MILTFKYRIKDRRARKFLAQHAVACNKIWNWCVAQHRDTLDRYRAGAKRRPWLSTFDLGRTFNGIGKDIGLHQQTVRSVCEQWSRDRSIRFRASFGLNRARGWVPFQLQSRKIDGNSVTYLGHTYRFFGNKRRPLTGNAKGGSFVEDALGRWWVCFHVEVEQAKAAIGEVGIDLGLKDFAVFSTGEKIAAPQFYRRHEERLVIAQRAGNASLVKALHMKVANRRRDFHHKLSTRLSRSYAFIAVGDVNPKRLAQTRMAKSVFDAGWSNFRSMLRYKAAQFAEVDEKFTTQTCSSCGALPPERPRGIAGLGIRVWECSACGKSHDRDVNAALNILKLGRSVTPLVEESRRAA